MPMVVTPPLTRRTTARQADRQFASPHPASPYHIATEASPRLAGADVDIPNTDDTDDGTIQESHSPSRTATVAPHPHPKTAPIKKKHRAGLEFG